MQLKPPKEVRRRVHNKSGLFFSVRGKKQIIVFFYRSYCRQVQLLDIIKIQLNDFGRKGRQATLLLNEVLNRQTLGHSWRHHYRDLVATNFMRLTRPESNDLGRIWIKSHAVVRIMYYPLAGRPCLTVVEYLQ